MQGPGDVQVCQVAYRKGGNNLQLREQGDLLEAVPYKQHRIYAHVLRTRMPLVIPNIDVYVEDADQEGFAQPTAHASKFFKSCLVLPIFGREKGTGPADQAIIGFFRLECTLENFFDSLYDKNIASELANYAAMLGSMFNLAEGAFLKAKYLAHPRSVDGGI
jgi:hypothetical protein